jgi:hypothetical protein
MITPNSVAPSEPAHRNGPKLWLIIPAVLLSCLSAYLFTRAASLALYYAWGPPRKIDWVDVLSIGSFAALVMAALFMGSVVRLTRIRSRASRLLARYLLAFVLCSLIFCAVAWTLRALRAA